MKFRNLFMLAAIMALLASCTKEFEEITFENKNPAIKKFFTFTTVEDYNNFLKSDNPISDIQIVNSYTSLKTIMERALELIDKCENINQVKKIVENSSNTLKLINGQNGDLTVEETITKFHPIFQILNEDGILKVEDTFYKFIEDQVFKSKNYSDLTVINSIDYPVFEGVTKYKSLKINSLRVLERWGDVNVPFGDEILNDNPYCKNDRKLIFEQTLVEVYNNFNDPYLGSITEARNTLYSIVKARRKGIPCVWYGYSTEITWNNFYNEFDYSFNGNVNNNNIWDGDDMTSTGYNIERSEYLGSYLFGIDSYDFQWTLINTDATHQGMAGDWLYYDYEL